MLKSRLFFLSDTQKEFFRMYWLEQRGLETDCILELKNVRSCTVHRHIHAPKTEMVFPYSSVSQETKESQTLGEIQTANTKTNYQTKLKHNQPYPLEPQISQKKKKKKETVTRKIRPPNLVLLGAAVVLRYDIVPVP